MNVGNDMGESPANRLIRFRQAVLPDAGMLFTGKRSPTRSWSRAVSCALQGLIEAWKTQPNFRLHALFGVGVTAAGLWCRLTAAEWLWISFSVGLLMFAELLNTAIERLVDLVVGLAPNSAARFIKDVAAGAVLVAAILAVVIGYLTFSPHLVVVLR